MEQQAQQVTLQLTINQLNMVLGGIAKLPIEVGLETFQVIQQQAQQQLGSPTSQVPPGPLSDKVVQ
jgi:hypothetical protein